MSCFAFYIWRLRRACNCIAVVFVSVYVLQWWYLYCICIWWRVPVLPLVQNNPTPPGLLHLKLGFTILCPSITSSQYIKVRITSSQYVKVRITSSQYIKVDASTQLYSPLKLLWNPLQYSKKIIVDLEGGIGWKCLKKYV